MSYLTRRFADGEEVVYEGRFNFMQKLWPWLALLVLGILVIGIVIWAAALIRMRTTRMLVTNRRVMLKRGFWAIHVDELTLSSIEGAEIDQGLFGRIFGFGKLTLRGRGDTHLHFPSMDRPGKFRAAVETARIAEEAKPSPVEVVEEEPVAKRRGLFSPRHDRHA